MMYSDRIEATPGVTGIQKTAGVTGVPRIQSKEYGRGKTSTPSADFPKLLGRKSAEAQMPGAQPQIKVRISHQDANDIFISIRRANNILNAQDIPLQIFVQDKSAEVPEQVFEAEPVEFEPPVLQTRGSYLEFAVHDKTRDIMVKIIDNNTDEIIREIPPEKMLNLVAGLWELAGILVDEQV